MGHFQVLFSGELVADADPDLVRRRLASRLNVDARKVQQLFSGRTVVLRSGLDEQDAFEFQRDLERLGAITRIKDRTPVARDRYPLADRLKDDGRQTDATLKDITAAHFECPRCGFLQLEAEFCSRCGVNIAQAMRERRKEDLLIEKRIRELREKQVRIAAQHSRHGLAADARRLHGPGTVDPARSRSGVRADSGNGAREIENSKRRQPHSSAETEATPLGRAGRWLRNLVTTR